MKKSGLGRGLSSLIDSDLPVESQNILEISLNDIEPNKSQPRRNFDEEALISLSESIKQHGIIQPIVVTKKDNFYEIIAGERRWRAARMAKIKKVPVIIKEDLSEQKIFELALIENIQREDLNPIEEAKGYKSLQDNFNYTQEQIAEIIGRNRTTITNFLRLLKLPEEIQLFLIEKEISNGHARCLLSIEDKEIQIEIAKKIITNSLSVRDTENLMSSLTAKKQTKKTKKLNPIFTSIENEIKSILNTKVCIKPGKRKGKIEIDYYSEDDLERILSMMQSIN